MKFAMTPPGIELATFRLVTQCLNQLCHRLPHEYYTTGSNFILVVLNSSKSSNKSIRDLSCKRLRWKRHWSHPKQGPVITSIWSNT